MRNYRNIDENSRIILDLQYKMFFILSMCQCVVVNPKINRSHSQTIRIPMIFILRFQHYIHMANEKNFLFINLFNFKKYKYMELNINIPSKNLFNGMNK